MHNPTSDGRCTSAPMGAMGLAKWHRWTVADGRYADYRSHRMAGGCCADGTARTMGVRRWAPRGDQCLADCSTTFGTRWGGSGSLISWQAAGAAGWGSGSAAKLAHTRCPVRRVRAARLPAHARGMPAPAAAAAPVPPGWRTRGAPCAGSPPPSPRHAHGTPALTAVAAASPWLMPTPAMALPSRSHVLTSRWAPHPCAAFLWRWQREPGLQDP